METARNVSESIVTTLSPRRNTTEILYISHEDVTELTIIVWTVGGVLLIALLILLGRIILSRKKDPFEAYQRHRNNVFRIRIDSEYFTPHHGSSISLSRDTTHLVTGALATSSESPSPQRNQSYCGSSSGNNTQNSDSPGHNSSYIHNEDSASAQDITTCNSAQSNTRASAQTNTQAPDEQETTPSCHRNRRLSISISTSDPLTVISNSHQTENSEIQRNQTTSDNVASDAIIRQPISNRLGGSRATLTNGVVISPPCYDDVIKTTTRLPSVVVSRPVRAVPRQALFSL